MTMKRKLHLEALRIIAIYFVILTHTGKRGFTYFTTLEPSFGYFLAICIPLLCNICVPLFYMISGATMLNKDEPPAQIWRRKSSQREWMSPDHTSAPYRWLPAQAQRTRLTGFS